MSSNTPSDWQNSASSKEERRKAAREVAKRVAEEDAARHRRNVLMGIIGAVLVVALVAGLIWFIVRSGNSNGSDGASGATATAQGTPDAPALQATNRTPIADKSGAPANTDQFGGIPVGKSGAAGTSNAGVPNVTIYFDYLCIYCNMLEGEYADSLAQQAKDGKITLTYVPIRIFKDSDFSLKGAEADYWVAANHPDLYIKFHNTMLTDVTEPLFKDGTEPSKAPAISKITDTAAKIGLDASEVDKLQKSLDSGEYAQWVGDQVKRFHDDGFKGTPTVLINEQELENWPNGVLNVAIDNAANGAASGTSGSATK